MEKCAARVHAWVCARARWRDLFLVLLLLLVFFLGVLLLRLLFALLLLALLFFTIAAAAAAATAAAAAAATAAASTSAAGWAAVALLALPLPSWRASTRTPRLEFFGAHMDCAVRPHRRERGGEALSRRRPHEMQACGPYSRPPAAHQPHASRPPLSSGSSCFRPPGASPASPASFCPSSSGMPPLRLLRTNYPRQAPWSPAMVFREEVCRRVLPRP